jgi:hypothetical protein
MVFFNFGQNVRCSPHTFQIIDIVSLQILECKKKKNQFQSKTLFFLFLSSLF